MITRKAERPFEVEGVADPPPAPDLRSTFDDRLNHILNAATGVIARVGYEKASMRMIAKAAEVSLAGIYHYFDGKEKVLFLMQFRTFNSLLNGLREKLQGVEDPVEQLHVMVRAHVAYFVANMPALKVCSHELDSLSGAAYEETRQIRRQYYELTRGIVERVIQQLAPWNTCDRHVATMGLFGTLNWLYRWYHPRSGRSPVALANQIVSQFLFGLTGRGEPVQAQDPAANGADGCDRTRSRAAPDAAPAPVEQAPPTRPPSLGE